MKLAIGDVAEKTGVSIRALRYYDEIGLLPPSDVTSAGYRIYDDDAIARLQEILFFRELSFPLADIKRILSSPDYDRREAMTRQRTLLQMKRERLDALLGLLDETLKGAKNMDLDSFSTRPIEEAQRKYAAEAAEKYGKTDAYKESKKRTAKYDKADWQQISGEMDEILRAFSEKIGSDPATLGALVDRWQKHITDRFYTCTDTILLGLADLYEADERFTQTMDKYAAGTAQLVSAAIRANRKPV